MDALADPKHPFNLPTWRKLAMLLALSAMAFVSNLEAAAHLTAFPQVARSLGCSIAQAANAIGAGILGLGTGPLLWNPLSTAVGRRPVYLISWTLFLPFMAWCALAPNLSQFLAARFLAGFCSSASQTIPVASIAEVWAPQSRGTAIAAWTLAVIVGPLIAPLICAAIISRPASWTWMYWTCLLIAAGVLILVVLFVPETLYTLKSLGDEGRKADAVSKPVMAPLTPVTEKDDVGDVAAGQGDHSDGDGEERILGGVGGKAVPEERVMVGHVGVAYWPWQAPERFFKTVVQPLRQALYLPILLTCVWSAWTFTISVGTTIITPQIFEKPPFRYEPVSVGLLFIASIVGAIGGKLVGGRVADGTIVVLSRRSRAGKREPELRLPALVFPTAMMLVGAILYGDGLERAESWVEPIIGSGIFYFGTSSIQGIVQTYCVECDLQEAASTIPLYNFVKSVFGFSAPFFIPAWSFRGLRTAYIVQGVSAAGSGLLLIVLLLVGGRRIRAAQGLPML